MPLVCGLFVLVRVCSIPSRSRYSANSWCSRLPQYSLLEIWADIEILRHRGYSAEIIIQKTGLSPKYVKDIIFLLDEGEERSMST